MIYSIENEFVKATVNQKGAELSSYINKENGINYLWKGDAKYWAKHAPVLFPVIGKVTNDSIKVNGVSYPMTKHGFARDTNFEVRKQSETTLEFVISSNDETKKSYQSINHFFCCKKYWKKIIAFLCWRTSCFCLSHQ
jgi:galactose mutarotase-like enzyme